MAINGKRLPPLQVLLYWFANQGIVAPLVEKAGVPSFAPKAQVDFFISQPVSSSLIGSIFCTQDSEGTRESLKIKLLNFVTSIFNLKVGERAQLSETRVGENTVIANKTSLTKVICSSSFCLFISNRTSLMFFSGSLLMILIVYNVINQVHLGKGCKIEEKVRCWGSFENIYYDSYFFGHGPVLSIC